MSYKVILPELIKFTKRFNFGTTKFYKTSLQPAVSIQTMILLKTNRSSDTAYELVIICPFANLTTF